jgi:hypothetical protein
MHSALVVVKIPEMLINEASKMRWQKFIAAINEVASAKPRHLDKEDGVSVLAENVWLVDLNKNPSALSRLMYHADGFSLPYGVLQLDEAPKWIPASFDPKTA